jgi:streptomycin 6-kinase
MPELPNHADVLSIIHNRITCFAELLEWPSWRILDLCFVKTVIAFAWAIEDGCDTRYFEELTKIFDKGYSDDVGSDKKH